MKKSTRKDIAQNTLKVLEDGKYFTATGTSINLRADQETAVKNSILYRPEDFEEVMPKVWGLLMKVDTGSTVFEVHNETTLEASERLVKQEGREKVLALNFASAKNPGGGFLGGAQAQEESLARSSGLYPTLLAHRDYYDMNRKCGTLFYTDHMIWSPDVPVFRKDNGELINYYPLAFLTSPAVNLGAMRNRKGATVEGVKEAMRDRIEKVLAICFLHGHKNLVLGAWGCGVFRNDPKMIAELFAEHL